MGFRDSSFYHSIRIPIRTALAWSLPGPMNPKRRIAVSGTPRSGTSWLAKCISLADGVSFYYEPDEPFTRECRYVYVPPDTENDRLERDIRRMWAGRVIGNYHITEKGFKELVETPFAPTILLKWVWLNFSLDWIARRFPGIVVVQTVRHPIPQFLSWRGRKWPPEEALDWLLKQPALMEGPLAKHADVMRRADGFWEKATAFWGATAAMQLATNRDGWILREHEWYCLAPEERIGWLVRELGLAWNDRIAEFLSPRREQNRGPGYGEARDPRTEVNKWRGKVKPEEVRDVEGIMKEFGLPFYPNLDPEVSWMDDASSPVPSRT
ncbi:MAG: hypothetical protein KC591_12380 [Gemmatimonadetes bacterium]|nr:hypothetical protein [Gemmatimonadota bacterium]